MIPRSEVRKPLFGSASAQTLSALSTPVISVFTYWRPVSRFVRCTATNCLTKFCWPSNGYSRRSQGKDLTHWTTLTSTQWMFSMTCFQTVCVLAKVLRDLYAEPRVLLPEASLAHIDGINAHLAETQHQLQNEIESLQLELRRSQDPERMQLIQEMISVSQVIHMPSGHRVNSTWIHSGPIGSNVTHPRKGNRV